MFEECLEEDWTKFHGRFAGQRVDHCVDECGCGVSSSLESNYMPGGLIDMSGDSRSSSLSVSAG